MMFPHSFEKMKSSANAALAESQTNQRCMTKSCVNFEFTRDVKDTGTLQHIPDFREELEVN